MHKIPFSQLPLSKEVLKSISEMGFEEATPIQGEAIPHILEGLDIIGQSRTGTGKTIAFAVPAVEKADPSKTRTQVLVLCPTRELCIQVSEEMGKLGRHKRGLICLPVYGGQSYERQIHGLKQGAHIVIGTPGRLMDHMKRGTLKLDSVSMVVLDEADEMLDMGFQEDLEFILKATPEDRQTVLFSATMPNGIKHLIKKYQKDPRTVKIAHEAMTVPETRQTYIELNNHMKLETLCRCLELHKVKLGIVFCNTRIGVDELVGHLQARGYSADGLHGDVKQAMRDKVMGKFRSGRVEILVATDVASRGIDVKNVEAVFNYDMPKDEEDYVHRIGRTGRAGQPGLAISFVNGREAYKLREIERFMKAKVTRESIPSLEDVEASQNSILLEKVKETLKAGDLGKYAGLVEKLMAEDLTAMEVASALLKMALPKPSEPIPERQGYAGKPAYAGKQAYADKSGYAGKQGYADKQGYDGKQGYAGKTLLTGKQGFAGKGKAGFGGKDVFPRKPGFGDRDAYKAGADSVKIFLSVGRMQDVRPKDILGALAGETGLPGNVFGGIEVENKHTRVEVPAEHVEAILAKMAGVRIKGVKVKASREDAVRAASRKSVPD